MFWCIESKRYTDCKLTCNVTTCPYLQEEIAFFNKRSEVDRYFREVKYVKYIKNIIFTKLKFKR